MMISGQERSEDRTSNVTDRIKYVYCVKKYWFECLLSGSTAAVKHTFL